MPCRIFRVPKFIKPIQHFCQNVFIIFKPLKIAVENLCQLNLVPTLTTTSSGFLCVTRHISFEGIFFYFIPVHTNYKFTSGTTILRKFELYRNFRYRGIQ